MQFQRCEHLFILAMECSTHFRNTRMSFLLTLWMQSHKYWLQKNGKLVEKNRWSIDIQRQRSALFYRGRVKKSLGHFSMKKFTNIVNWIFRCSLLNYYCIRTSSSYEVSVLTTVANQLSMENVSGGFASIFLAKK